MKLTFRQGFCFMTCFLLGNVLSGIGAGSGHEKTGYIAVFFSFIPLLLLIFLYREVLKKNENLGFFEMIPHLFGSFFSKLIFLAIALYSFLAAFFSISNLTNFMEASTYFKTPKFAALAVVLLLILYLCISREKTMGRYAEIVLPIVLLAICLLFLFGVKHFQKENLVFRFSAKNFITQGLDIFIAPFSEIIFVYLLFDMLKDRTKITKIAISSCLLTGILFFLLYLFNLLILGEKLMGAVSFPTFFAASVVEVGTVIEKAETLITFSYTFCDLLYGGACIYLFTKAVSLLCFKTKKQTKKITAVIAVILIFLLLSIPGLSENLRAYYREVSICMIPFTIGLPLVMFMLTLLKTSNTKGHFQKSCSNGDHEQ